LGTSRTRREGEGLGVLGFVPVEEGVEKGGGKGGKLEGRENDRGGCRLVRGV